jgi:hypothetical protein
MIACNKTWLIILLIFIKSSDSWKAPMAAGQKLVRNALNSIDPCRQRCLRQFGVSFIGFGFAAFTPLTISTDHIIQWSALSFTPITAQADSTGKVKCVTV